MLAACSPKAASPTEAKTLNLYIWNDFLAPDTLANFEKETGIKVFETNFASDEEAEAKIAAGSSGYDIVVPSGSFYGRQIRAGFYRKLDKKKLPNLTNMDPEMLKRMTMDDPDNEHAVLHIWGTLGLGYNVDKVAALAPDAPLDSWALLFDPAVAAKLEKCGIGVVSSASDMFSMALSYLGKDSQSQDVADNEAAAAAMMKIRPFVRYIATERTISDLANGEICLTAGSNGDIQMAHARAEEDRTGQRIAYASPREGSSIWFESYLIPKDAPHPENAHTFINYMLRPEVIGAVTNAIHYSNANVQAARFVDKEVLADQATYPPPAVMKKLVPDLGDGPEITRLKTRLWTKFVTGR